MIFILTAIGALIAAATVVFNNLILAFMAGLILTSKRMVVIGDWIEVPVLQISGEVREITFFDQPAAPGQRVDRRADAVRRSAAFNGFAP